MHDVVTIWVAILVMAMVFLATLPRS